MASTVLDYVTQAITVYVVGLCVFGKVPQLKNVFSSQSTKGLSVKSIAMELWCFCILVGYSASKGLAVVNFMEQLIISISDVILLGLVLYIQGDITPINISIFVGFLSYIAFLGFGPAPSWLIYAMLMTVNPMLASSKVVQIWSIVSSKTSGSVSAATWLMATSASGGKMITLLLRGGWDPVLLFTASLATALNVILVACIYIYREPVSKKKDSASKKKDSASKKKD